MTPDMDGITHINIYSKGQTELGRFLSNFSYSPIMTEDGAFQSVEGYWYWLGLRHEGLRHLSGFQAKQFGKELRTYTTPYVMSEGDFKRKIEMACRIKIQSNMKMLSLLVNSTLPFKHYYVMNGRVMDAGYGWILDMWDKIRTNLFIPYVEKPKERWCTGVGSRETPAHILELMYKLSSKVSSRGWGIRTGNARGADEAFRSGAGNKLQVFSPGQETFETTAIAKCLYPNQQIWSKWEAKNSFAIPLHGRNPLQVFGPNMDEPSLGFICWTKDGCVHHNTRTLDTGGTGTAISIATIYAEARTGRTVPVTNLNNPVSYAKWNDWVK